MPSNFERTPAEERERPAATIEEQPLEDGSGVELVLKGVNNEENLSERLPRGWRFQSMSYEESDLLGAAHGYVSNSDKTIYYNSRFTQYGFGKVASLVILHEMGHVIDSEKEKDERQKYRLSKEDSDLYKEVIAKSFIELPEFVLLRDRFKPGDIREAYKKGKLDQMVDDIFEKIRDDVVVKQNLLDYYDASYRGERNAWAEGLRLLRQLRKDGLDPTAGASSDELQGQVHESLSAYEDNYRRRLRKLGLEDSELAKTLRHRKKSKSILWDFGGL